MISALTSSSSISYASSAASMSSFSSDSSSLSKSREKLLNNNNTNNHESQTKVKNAKQNNKEVAKMTNLATNTTRSPSLSILARVKKLQHEKKADLLLSNSPLANRCASLTNFENFSEMIASQSESVIVGIGGCGLDADMDTLKIEKISNSLRTKIENLIQSYAMNVSSFKSGYPAASSSLTATFNASSSAFKPTNTNASNDLIVSNTFSLNSAYDDNFISSLFGILFSMNYKCKNMFFFASFCKSKIY